MKTEVIGECRPLEGSYEEECMKRQFRQEALRLSTGVVPEGQSRTTGFYNEGIRKTAQELIRDAETILKYLKDGIY